MLTLEILLLLVGFAALYFGADWMVNYPESLCVLKSPWLVPLWGWMWWSAVSANRWMSL